MREIAATHGTEDETYARALNHITSKSRNNGIDGALQYVDQNHQTREFDGLLLCDRSGVGQQLAAQAGKNLRSFILHRLTLDSAGYPIICVPIGLDAAGLPFSLSIQHTAWREDVLIKWASAIEDLIHEIDGWRPLPTYRNHLSKNIPIINKSTG